ncbi:hypothetical protein [Parabacteroides merdae]|uniref:hypothetical protein n=1 Tax=Parabacteroides merdae TaxID=46503 RepID=UPI001C227D1E|nr:hypothetical protein [Parabacteroides merdae]MBU9059521.1 hypothetical protein [Parabacteroides merdae]MCG4835584.1 hypothetical protein [Parabacteroides merdae]MCQ5193789.1 hypothetical protein [Parabacteroides merdae]
MPSGVAIKASAALVIFPMAAAVCPIGPGQASNWLWNCFKPEAAPFVPLSSPFNSSFKDSILALSSCPAAPSRSAADILRHASSIFWSEACSDSMLPSAIRSWSMDSWSTLMFSWIPVRRSAS